MTSAEPELPGGAPQARGGRRFALRLIGAAIALGLLWLVARSVPWEDAWVIRTAEFEGAEAAEFRVEGELEGDWKLPTVQFTPDVGSAKIAEQEGPTAWAQLPAILREDLAAGRTLELSAGAVRCADGTQLTLTGTEWRPSIPRVFRDIHLAALVPAMGLIVLCSLFIVTRWWRLLGVMQCASRWWSALRVTYVGLFFNVIVPGNSGGDLARVWMVIKGHPERRADAFMSVILDRLLGLAAMGLVAAAAVLSNGDRFGQLRLPVSLVALAMGFGLLALGSLRLRSWIRLDSWLGKLPQGERLVRLDGAIRGLAQHPWEVLIALFLSVGNHLGASLMFAVLGSALGAELSILDYICIATVVNTLTAVPISPGGLGVGEVLSGSLFEMAGESFTLGVATSITYRICLALLGLVGGLVLLAPGGKAMRSDFEAAERELGAGV